MTTPSDGAPSFPFIRLPDELRCRVVGELANAQDFGDLLTLQRVSKDFRDISRQILKYHLPPGRLLEPWLKNANEQDLSSIQQMDLSVRTTFDSKQTFVSSERENPPSWQHKGYMVVFEAARTIRLVAVLPNLKTIRIQAQPASLRVLVGLLVGRSIVVDLRLETSLRSDRSNLQSSTDILQLMTAGQLRSLELSTHKDKQRTLTIDWSRTVAELLCSSAAHLEHVSCAVPRLRFLQESPSSTTANGLTRLSLIPSTELGARETVYQCMLGTLHSGELARCLHTANLRELHILYVLTAPAIDCLSSLHLPAVWKCTFSCFAKNGELIGLLDRMPSLQELTLLHVEDALDRKTICVSLPSQLTALHIFCDQRFGIKSSIVYSTEDIALLSATCPHLIAVSMPISRNAVSSLQALSAWRLLSKLNIQLVVLDIGDLLKAQDLPLPPSSTVQGSSAEASISYIRAALHLCAIDGALTRQIGEIVFPSESRYCELTISACYDGFLLSRDDSADRSAWMRVFAAIMKPYKLVRSYSHTHVLQLAVREPEEVVRSSEPGIRSWGLPSRLLGVVRTCLYSIWPDLRAHVPGREWELRRAHLWSDAISALPASGYAAAEES